MSDPIICEGVNLSEPDPVAAALARENTAAMRSALGDLRLNEDRAKCAMEKAGEDRAARVRPAILAARRAFHNAAIPASVRKTAWIRWASNDGASINWNARSEQYCRATLYLRYEINVGAATYVNNLSVACIEDAIAAGWATWPVVEAMLRAYPKLPATVTIPSERKRPAPKRRTRTARKGGKRG